MLKDEPSRAASAAELFAEVGGVLAVTTNARTGSITIEFDHERVGSGQLINRLASAGLISGVIGFPGPLTRRVANGPVAAGDDAAVATGESAPQLASVVQWDNIVRLSEATAVPGPLLSPQARQWLGVAARILVPVLAERAFGRTGRAIIETLIC
jgi:hypothetical protein